MLVMRTIEDPANPLGQLVSAQRIAVGLDHFSLAVDPLGFYGVKPRALLGQKAAYDPHSFTTLFDLAVVCSEPAPDLFGDVPTGVVPDEDHNFLSRRVELLQAPRKELRRYGTDGPPIHEPDPRLLELGHIEPVAGYGLRFEVVFGDRLLEETKRLSLLAPTVQSGQGQPTPPALVQETNRPAVGIGLGHFHQSIASEASLFSFIEGVGRGDPAFRSRPPDSEKAHKSSPDGLPRDRPFEESLLKGNLCRHLQSPEATLTAKLPRRAVEHLPQGLSLFGIEGPMNG